jgi:hypothetical protein
LTFQKRITDDDEEKEVLLLDETEELLRQIEMNPKFTGVDNLASSTEDNNNNQKFKYIADAALTC